MDASTQIGPLATAQVLETTARQVRALLDTGARLLIGGQRLERAGYFYAPTILADVPLDAAAAQEEIFAPVALLYRADSFDDAIALANYTPFGLGASVWTRDESERRQAIAALECGSVFVNAMVKSDPRLPFGGIKQSGYGRELGRLGILEFVNAKTVWVN
jgi:succinate-semialdehyde dehydrogenase/glutarate-semialdehyde dehydrogenase